MSTTKTKKSINLVGRQVYFKLSKKKLEANIIIGLTPNKLYTILSHDSIEPYSETILITFEDDTNKRLRAILGLKKKHSSAHLGQLTHWILKRKETK